MTTVPINRRFYEWSDDGLGKARYQMLGHQSEGTFGWAELLAKRRVVILAEAGSGKTEELREQARLQAVAGRFAFYATVQDVGRDGLDKALRLADRPRLQAWRASDEPGWFFIDSIDEAKLDNIRLDRALRKLADAIAGSEGRAYIILSGRHTDWEFARDARRFHDELPLPRDGAEEALPTLETLIKRVLRHEEKLKPTPAETLLIVVMAPLDDGQMRCYAAAKDAPDLERLMAAIAAANMHAMARRPLDLDWIVRYWRQHHRLGGFTAMIEASLRERLQETDPDRRRRDSLDAERAMRGLERVGAALVLGRRAIIAIPDNEATIADDQTAGKLDDVLPDWSNEDRQQLLSRPAFDPATFGRARLHNDNEGVVRAYLTARWLQRLRQANLSQARLFDLLFATLYEIDLIKPSMQETAAWLSAWDENVARETVRRVPYLLLTAGDPASLPPQTRRAVLQAVVEHMRRDEEVPLLDLDGQRRFAQPDLAATLHTLWDANKGDDEIRRFLLRLIWLGAIQSCGDLAISASFGGYEDPYTAIVAGRAVMATGAAETRQAYADYVKGACGSMSATAVWDAVDSLFPAEIGIDDFLAIVAVVRLGDDEGGGFNLDYSGPDLVGRLTRADDLTQLIEGLLLFAVSDTRTESDVDRPRKGSECATTLAAAAWRLLILAPPGIAPDATIDAVLCLGRQRLYRAQWRSEYWTKAVEQLHRTAPRRRRAFWRAAEKLGANHTLVDRPLLYLFQMDLLGWPPGLALDDVDWLLADGPGRSSSHERRLAVDAALHLWRAAGESAELKAHIAAVAASDADMHEAYVEWLRPRVRSPEETQGERELAAIRTKNERERDAREQGWIEFVASLRADPELLRHLQPTTSTTVDGRMFNLWQLLNQATSHVSRYGIESVAPIVEIAGQAVAAAFSDGLSKIWREWQPTLRSARPPGQRNLTDTVDCMGLAGVSIEAATDTTWASELTEDEAVRAAEYATLEINGLPAWMAALSSAWPAAVERVLAREITSDLDDPMPDIHYRSLEGVSRADDGLASLMSPVILRELHKRDDLKEAALRTMLQALSRGLAKDRKRDLYALAIKRFQATSDPQLSALYLGAACAIDGRGGTDALIAKVDGLNDEAQTALVERVLPELFGSRFARSKAVSMDFATLERLVLIAYRTVRIEDDHDRANQGVYSPDERDNAQEARSAAFAGLVNTPGRAAFDAIMRFMETPDFPVAASRLRALAWERAAKDAEHTVWKAGEPLRFERDHERPPITERELQLVAMQRLDELQHDLNHGDFQQGAMLSVLPGEVDVQNWIADRLRHAQGVAYSVEREVHVADEKEPDLRLRAKASDVSVAVEIKVAGNTWTLPDLENALVDQLCGQYLRAPSSRHGIFLVVYQVARPNGWKGADGAYVSFESLVRHLQDLAAAKRAASPLGPQPEVCVIDVSSEARPRTKRDRARRRANGLPPTTDPRGSIIEVAANSATVDQPHAPPVPGPGLR